MTRFNLTVHFLDGRKLETFIDTTKGEDFKMSDDNRLALFDADGGKTCYTYPTNTISRIKCEEVA